ncbi:MAG: hypothetical protein EB079_03040, partial [Verrucomicrobia bacterium]|nr:hypothetical protein [Verrucomicrobiota bacterium]
PARFTGGEFSIEISADSRKFLEVNPNGQFAWLDQSGRQGMLKAILEELTTTRPTKPIRPLLR